MRRILGIAATAFGVLAILALYLLAQTITIATDFGLKRCSSICHPLGNIILNVEPLFTLLSTDIFALYLSAI